MLQWDWDLKMRKMTRIVIWIENAIFSVRGRDGDSPDEGGRLLKINCNTQLSSTAMQVMMTVLKQVAHQLQRGNVHSADGCDFG